MSQHVRETEKKMIYCPRLSYIHFHVIDFVHWAGSVLNYRKSFSVKIILGSASPRYTCLQPSPTISFFDTVPPPHVKSASTENSSFSLGSKSKKKLRKFGHMSNFHYPIYLVSLYGQKKIWTWD